MARLVLWVRWLVAAWLLALPAAAMAQDRNPEGLWAMRAGGHVLAILALRRDARAPGGWAGAWTRPDRFTIDDVLRVSEISGPTVTRPIRSAASRGDGFELTVQGRDPAGAPDVLTFRLVAADRAELGWKDAPLPPIALERAPAGSRVAEDWEAGGQHALAQPPRRPNPEMTELFRADQAPRLGPGPIDWAAVEPADRRRRARTRQLLDAGAIASGDDFYHAAFIFQHGSEADDFLLAHTLALVAIARGRADATWIAAATLDRYLQNIGRGQIYGTQYSTPPGRPATQEPYDRTLVSDALRQALGVPPQAEQGRRRAEFEARARGARPTERE